MWLQIILILIYTENLEYIFCIDACYILVHNLFLLQPVSYIDSRRRYHELEIKEKNVKKQTC